MDTNIPIAHLSSLLEISDGSIAHRLVRFFAFFFSIMGAENRKTGTKGFLVVDDAVSLRELATAATTMGVTIGSGKCYYLAWASKVKAFETDVDISGLRCLIEFWYIKLVKQL
jgi:hypothetical protein